MSTVPGSRQRHPTLRRAAAGGLGLAAVGVLAACVPAGYGNYSPTAGRAATPVEALAVITAVHSSPLTAGAGAGARPYRLEAIRVSARTPGYAFATLDPTTPAADGAAVALRATRTTGRHLSWQLFDIGSAHVGCTSPVPVRIEFALHC